MKLPQPLYVELTQEQIDFARVMAESAAIGGHSHVHCAPNQRQRQLGEDQVTGQLGQIAGCVWARGGIDEYAVARAYATVYSGSPHPTPIRGSNVGVKGSLIRGTQGLWQYRLPVRPGDIRRDSVYVLALVPPDSFMKQHPVVLLVGWATTDEFPDEVESGGPCEGAYVRHVPQLHSLPPFRWPGGGAQVCDDVLLDAIEDAAGVPSERRWAKVRERWSARQSQLEALAQKHNV